MKDYSNYTRAQYDEDVQKGEIFYVEPMTCKEGDFTAIDSLLGDCIAQEKYDGHRAIMFLGKESRIFSRTDSKKSKWKSENTNKLPHLRDALKDFKFPIEVTAVLDGELLAASKEFKDVQSITGALDEKAIAFQEEHGYADYYVFDILMFCGADVRELPYWRRYSMLSKFIYSLHKRIPNLHIHLAPIYCSPEVKHISDAIRFDLVSSNHPTDNLIYVDSYYDLLKSKWDNGKEGLVLKKVDGVYEHNRSSNCLKFKEHRTYDVVITGYKEPTREYTGKTLREKGIWNYWEDKNGGLPYSLPLDLETAKHRGLSPVTKPYAMGWIGAITCGVYKGDELVDIVEVKGITDADQEYIKENREKLKGTCIEITAQGLLSEEKKSLRHPRFNRWRTVDKNPKDCTWETIK